MKLLNLFLLFALSLIEPLLGETIHSKLSMLSVGDEIVYDFHNSITVIGVTHKTEHIIQLRVATATNDILSREGFSTWLQWFQHGAPGAATDETILLQIDHMAVQNESAQNERWLLTLLGLELSKVQDVHRRRAGPPPMPGEIDLRPPFQPRIIVNEHQIESKSDAYFAQWPNDGTELSSRPLILYFPQSSSAVHSFPYWIESPTSAYHVRVIDSSHP